MSSQRIPVIRLTEEFAYPVTATVSTFYLLFWQAMKVSYVRHQAKIAYPQLYAEKVEAEASLAARVFNCMQRAHQNTLEQIPVIVSGTLIGGLTYPIAAAAFCGTWVFMRVLYTIGYSTGDPEKRKMAGSIPITTLCFVGLVGTSTATAVSLIRSLSSAK